MSVSRSRIGALRRLCDAATDNARSVSTYTLPSLKYAYNALEPHIDERTMTVSYCDWTEHFTFLEDNSSIDESVILTIIAFVPGAPYASSSNICFQP